MSRQMTLAMFVIVAALGLLGLVMVQAAYTPHQVAAKGCPLTGGMNGDISGPALKSGGRCLHQ